MADARTTQPPWAMELLAKNMKVARNMAGWTSTESYLGGSSNGVSVGEDVVFGHEGREAVNNHSAYSKVVDPVGVPSSSTSGIAAASTYWRTEKSTPIREDGVEDNRKEMRDKMSGEESILEYGPGIVRKLRSRYQSLALRQNNVRPSLRRSASLENCLDSVGASAEVLELVDLEVDPPPRANHVDENERNSYKSSMTINVRTGPVQRGRAAGNENSNVNRRDRMRRARSVDALHRTRHEEEILEKFKTVVLPKEDIVIIEVSKPRANLSNLSSFDDKGLKGNSQQILMPPPTSNFNLTISPIDYYNQHQLQRVRSVTSPEHELPPPNIVCETARIFEKNQENINANKKVGHALRLNKSNSVSSFGSPSPPPTPSPTSASASVLNQRNNHVMAQGSPSMQAVVKEKEISPSPSFPISKANVNNTKAMNTNAVGSKSSHGSKQVGVIRPIPSSTLNGDRGPSPISPITVPNKSLQFSKKPPLSPKPIFTSSPKSLLTSQKASTIGSSSEKSPNNHADSPEPRHIDASISKQVTNSRTKPSVPSAQPVQNRGLILNGNASTVSGNNANIPSSPSPTAFASEGTEKQETIFPVSFKPTSNKTVGSVKEPVDNSNLNGSAALTELKSVILKKSNDANVKSEPKSNNSDNDKVVKNVPQEQKKEQQQNLSNGSVKKKEDKQSKAPSQLRSYQKQKLSQSGNESMVFNFTNRQKVPDYIEDDGLHKRKITLDGTVTDESHDDTELDDSDRIDGKLIQFEGANVIINGRSSIQKKPKSQKLNISFNEDATTTFEYPSEASILGDSSIANEEVDKDTLLGQKTPNVINSSGSGLGSYTPSKMNSLYELGTYNERLIDSKVPVGTKDENTELIEDYLKPDTESTTWSNEMGADILF